MPSVVRAQGQSNGVALVIGNSKYHWESNEPQPPAKDSSGIVVCHS
jgi:hypothetical protein